MESTGNTRSQVLSYVYQGLIILFIFLCLTFIVGTVYGVFFNDTPEENVQRGVSQVSGEEHIFTGIGRVRIPTSDSEPGMVIIFVSFVYYPEDRPFSEELALRVGDFRTIIREYLGSFHIAELQQLGEESLKTELLRRLNAVLRLGQIEVLYFTDFMVVG